MMIEYIESISIVGVSSFILLLYVIRVIHFIIINPFELHKVLSHRSELGVNEITGNQLLDEMKRELDLPSTEDWDQRSRSKIIEYFMYSVYLLFVALVPLLYFELSTLLYPVFVVPATLLIAGMISNILTVWRIDRRVITSSSKPIEGRRDSLFFTFYQLSIFQVLIVLTVVTANYLLSDYILFSIMGRKIELYIVLLISLGSYIYIFKLNSISFNWYLTGQPFWIPMKEILVIPLSSVKKRLAVFRLVLWIISFAVAYAELVWTITYPYLSLIAGLVFLFVGVRYIKADLKYTMRLSLTVTTKLNQNLPKPVVSAEDEFDPAQARNLLSRQHLKTNQETSWNTSWNTNWDTSRNTDRNSRSMTRINGSSYRRDAVDEKAKESFNRLVQTVIAQREEINRLYNETNRDY